VRSWELSRLDVSPHAPVVLHSDDGANRVIALALPAGDSLSEHQVHEQALVFVVEGELSVQAGDEQLTLSAPGLAQFEPAERHQVLALSDCRLVLCLAPWPGEGHPRRAAEGG
jgi:quercetin dioxygenase-like cupin family protein